MTPPQLSKLSTNVAAVLITYNRASLLMTTLRAFHAALPETPLLVLDNASTDDTPNTVQNLMQSWPTLSTHRNPYNIGGNANILRSVELLNTEYHWVIGDDDHWCFSQPLLDELNAVLEKGEADIIRLGWLVSDESRGKLMPARQLAEQESLFFASVSMISATLMRRSLVTRYLPQAYHNISDSYPQLVCTMLAIEELPLKVYTLSANLMVHTPSREPGYFHGDLEWFACWYRSSRFLRNPRLKKRFVNEASLIACQGHRHPNQQFILLTKIMLYFKSFGLSQRHWLLVMLLYGTGWRLRVFAMLLIDLFTPAPLLSLARKAFFRLKGKPQKTLRVDRSRL